MPNVTVPGATGHNTVTLHFAAGDNLMLAQQLAALISSGQGSGTLVGGRNVAGSNPPTPPAGSAGVLYNTLRGLFSLPSHYAALVNTGDAAYVGNGGLHQAILSDSRLFAFETLGGSGTVVGGDATNYILDDANSKGWVISVGNGTNDITTGTGHDTVFTGSGHSTIRVGAGATTVHSGGSDQIDLTTGSATIDATGRTTVNGGTGHLTFTSLGDGSVVYAGTGAASLTAGSGNDYFVAQGARAQTFIAASGNATLNGAEATGADTFQLGGGKALVVLGSGKDTVVAGSGKATIFAGAGKDVFSFVNGEAAGVDRIIGFTGADKLSLTGYGIGEVKHAVATETHANGATTVTLSDNTKIVLVGVSTVSSSNFG